MVDAVVIDSNLFVPALLKAETAPRIVLRLCLENQIRPLMGNALLNEFEILLERDNIFKNLCLSARERQVFLDDFLSQCKWVNVYYLWRPNFRDEADNHVVELAVAGGATHIITGDIKDFKDSELTFPQLKIITAREYIEERKL